MAATAKRSRGWWWWWWWWASNHQLGSVQYHHNRACVYYVVWDPNSVSCCADENLDALDFDPVIFHVLIPRLSAQSFIWTDRP